MGAAANVEIAGEEAEFLPLADEIIAGGANDDLEDNESDEEREEDDDRGVEMRPSLSTSKLSNKKRNGSLISTNDHPDRSAVASGGASKKGRALDEVVIDIADPSGRDIKRGESAHLLDKLTRSSSQAGGQSSKPMDIPKNNSHHLLRLDQHGGSSSTISRAWSRPSLVSSVLRRVMPGHGLIGSSANNHSRSSLQSGSAGGGSRNAGSRGTAASRRQRRRPPAAQGQPYGLGWAGKGANSSFSRVASTSTMASEHPCGASSSRPLTPSSRHRRRRLRPGELMHADDGRRRAKSERQTEADRFKTSSQSSLDSHLADVVLDPQSASEFSSMHNSKSDIRELLRRDMGQFQRQMSQGAPSLMSGAAPSPAAQNRHFGATASMSRVRRAGSVGETVRSRTDIDRHEVVDQNRLLRRKLREIQSLQVSNERLHFAFLPNLRHFPQNEILHLLDQDGDLQLQDRESFGGNPAEQLVHTLEERTYQLRRHLLRRDAAGRKLSGKRIDFTLN